MTRFDLDPHAPSDLAIRSILDGVDHTAGEMDRKWGIGRLRLLVDDQLRARFDRQRLLLDQAIGTNLEVEIRTQAEAMKRAYAALDKVAHAAGAKVLSAKVWEVALPSTGEIVAIVRTEADLAGVPPWHVAFTIDEVARLLDGLPSAVARIKAAWPQARVERAGPMDWDKGDDLPPELRA